MILTRTCKVDEKINLYSYCTTDFGFKKIKNPDEEELSGLLKILICISST